MLTCNLRKRSGFSMVEVVVALFFVTLALLLVGALSKQVMNLSKSSKQVGTVVELQNRTNSLLTDTSAWLARMRVSEHITKDVGGKSVFSGCVPDSLNSSTFDCPDHDASIIDPLSGDPSIISAAQGYNAVSYTEIVDRSNNVIAGTNTNPAYMDAEGRVCEESDSDCKQKASFKSVGYFLRQFDGDVYPGNIKFLIKVEKITGSTANQNTMALKPKYISIDVGKSWEFTSAGGSLVSDCPVTTPALIKVGYLNDGTPQCIKPTASCSSGSVQVGVLPGGAPKCESVTTCASGQELVLDPVTHGLLCVGAGESPCTSPDVHIGYYAGSGVPMCEPPVAKCSSTSIDNPSTPAIGDMITVPTVQMGEQDDGTPLCIPVPPCPTTSPLLSFNGTAFTCVATKTPTQITANTCPAGQAVVKINDDGTSQCGPITSNTPPTEGCADGQISLGTDADGKEICDNVTAGFRCAAGTYLVGMSDSGAPICEMVNIPVVSGPSGTCSVGQYVTGFDSTGKIVCQGSPTIKTVSKTIVFPSCLGKPSCSDTFNLASYFPEITGKQILNLTASNYGYSKYGGKTCNTRVTSLSVSSTAPTKTHTFFTLKSTIELNAASQTLKMTNSGTTKDGAGVPCIHDGTITIQYL